MLSNLKLNNSKEFYERGQTGVPNKKFLEEVDNERDDLNSKLPPVHLASNHAKQVHNYYKEKCELEKGIKQKVEDFCITRKRV